MSRRDVLIGLSVVLFGAMLAGIVTLWALIIGGSLTVGTSDSIAALLPSSKGGSVVVPDDRSSHARHLHPTRPDRSTSRATAKKTGGASSHPTARLVSNSKVKHKNARSRPSKGDPSTQNNHRRDHNHHGNDTTQSGGNHHGGGHNPPPQTMTLALVNSLDASQQKMHLGEFGFTGTTLFALAPQDPNVDSCSLSKQQPAVFSVDSSNSDVATVSPDRISFTSCTGTKVVHVLPETQGNAQITLSPAASDPNVHLNAGEANFGVSIESRPAPDLEPTVQVPADISVQSEDGQPRRVNFDATASDPEDGPLTPICTPASGSVFPIGDTNVVCAATDSGGLTYRASFNVHLASSPVEPPPPPTEDTLPPFSPTVTVPSPDYVDQDGAWYRAPITVQVQDNGDRQSTDGSPVSGVDPSSYQTQITITDSGPHTISGLTVKDLAGNESNAAPGITLQLDAGAPAVDLTCPDVPVVEGTDLTASWTASDSGSGLSTPAAGTLQLDTNEEGHYVATLPAGSAVDNVGNDSAETSCSYVVLEAPKPDPSPTTPPEANPGPDSSATGATLPPGNTQPDPGDGAASQGAATDNALTGQLDPGDGPAAMGLIRQVGPPAASGVEP